VSAPGSTFYITGGTLRPDAPCYVERQADRDLFDGLRRGEFCYVLTSRQMGKSSLMVRTAARLREQGVAVAVLDLTAIGQNVTPEQWYDGLLARMGRQLELEDELEAFWHDHPRLGTAQRFFSALRDVVLHGARSQAERAVGAGPASSSPTGRVVLFVDEIDAVRSLPFSSDEFFAAIRECYNRRADDPEFNRLTFCLLGVATPSDLIRDTRTTPFNVGRRIELHDFLPEEAAPLARGLCARLPEAEDRASTLDRQPQTPLPGRARLRPSREPASPAGARQEPRPAGASGPKSSTEPASAELETRNPELETQNSERLLARVLHWTNGHPYLTQRLCQALVAELATAPVADPAWVDRVCADLFLTQRARDQDDNLIFVRERLLRSEVDRAELLTLYARTLRVSPLRLNRLERWFVAGVARLRRRPCVGDDPANPVVSVLRLSGLVRLEAGCLRVRNRIYAAVFGPAWVRDNLPDAELRRQRSAFWLGVLRTGSIALVLLAVMAGLVAYATREARRARQMYAELSRASVQAFLAQARSGRLLGQAGQRFDGLDSLGRATRIIRAEEAPADLQATLAMAREEAIACLARPDLRVGRSWPGAPPGTAGVAFSRDLRRYTRSDAQGNLSVRTVEGDVAVLELPGAGIAASRLEFSPAGTHLAALYPRAARADFRVWDLSQRLATVHWTNAAAEAAFDFNSGNDWVGVCGADGGLYLFGLNPATNRVLPLPGAARIFRFRPGTAQVAVSRAASLSVEIVAIDSGQTVASLPIAGAARALAWSEDATRLAIAGPSRRLRVWHLAASVAFDLEGHQDAPTQLAFSPSGQLLASAGPDSTLCLWDPNRSGGPAVKLEAVLDVRQLQFSPDGRQLAGNVAAERLQRWEVEPGGEFRSYLDPRGGRFADLDVHPSGLLAACAYEEGVALWDLAYGRKILALAYGSASASRFDPANGHLIVRDLQGVWWVPLQWPGADRDKPIEVGPRQLLALPGPVLQLAWAPDGQALAMLWNERVRVFEPDAISEVADLTGEPGLTAVAVGPERRWVAAAHGAKQEVYVWRLTGNRPRLVLPVEGRAQLAASRDGTHLAVGTEAQCSLWNVATGQREWTRPRPRPGVRPACLAFSPKGDVLALTTEDAEIELVETATGALVARLESPRKEPLLALRFTPHGRRLVGATEGSSIEVWNLAALREGLARLQLDWPHPAESPATTTPAQPLSAVLLGEELDNKQAVRRLRKEQELARLTEGLRQNPHNPRLLHDRAFCLSQLGRYEESAADWRACLKLQPNNAWAMRDLAYIHLAGPTSLRDYPQAAELAGRAAELEPDNADNLYRAGLAHFRMGHYTNAVGFFVKASVLPAEKQGTLAPSILIHLAMCHAHLGRRVEARECYEQAVALAESDPAHLPYRSRFNEFKAEAEQLLRR
jgi:WD40 repeat protein